MRALSLIGFTRSAGSKGAQLVALTLLVAGLAAPPALAQSGGISLPDSGGARAPDPAPTPAKPTPDPAPTPDSGTDETAPAPRTAPPPAPAPETTSSTGEMDTPATASPSQSGTAESAAPRAGQRQRRKAGTRARPNKARDKGGARSENQGSTPRRASPASVFGVNLAFAARVGGDTGAAAESPPVELIAWALLTLVLAAAGLLMLTARLAQMEGVAASMPWDAPRFQRILQIARSAPRSTRGRPAS
jgi:DNA polymerase-3 subunit gamma/tau